MRLYFFLISRNDSNSEQISLLSCRSDCRENWEGIETAALFGTGCRHSQKSFPPSTPFTFTQMLKREPRTFRFFVEMQGSDLQRVWCGVIFVKSLADLLLWRCLYLFATFLFKFLVAFLDIWHCTFQWPNRQQQKWLQQWGWRSAPRSLLFEVSVQFSRLALRHSWQLVWGVSIELIEYLSFPETPVIKSFQGLTLHLFVNRKQLIVWSPEKIITIKHLQKDRKLLAKY